LSGKAGPPGKHTPVANGFQVDGWQADKHSESQH